MKKYPSEYKHKESTPEYFCEKFLGMMGRMVGGSKSIYSYDNPKNVIVFNANIATEKDGKVWHGDLDLTLDHEKLVNLNKKIGKFYVFYESDLRFGKEYETIDFSKSFCAYDSGEIQGLNTEYFEVVKGIPKKKKQKKVKKAPEKSPYEDKKSNFSVVKIPDISALKTDKNTSGWLAFQLAIKEMHGDNAQEIYSNLYLTKEDALAIDKLTEKMIKKYHKYLHKVKVQQSVSMENLSLGCLDFQVTPSWARCGVGYLRKS